MQLERLRAERPKPPFPIYRELASHLLTAHGGGSSANGRDAILAHVLGTYSGYTAADLPTVAMMMSRLGLEDSACVRVSQVVDAMLIFSTAFMVQSVCGRVVILCFRGTEPANVGNWLGDADVGPEPIEVDGECINVHSGFYRNLRATRLAVLDELACAIEGRSLADHAVAVESPLEALFVTGHSLGGAMAVLFALGVSADKRQRVIAERLRAVYTYGQPMVVTEPLPRGAAAVGQMLFRHVMPRDPVPYLPPVGWGPFVHLGSEYTFINGEWIASDTPTAQLEHPREISRMLLGFAITPKRRFNARFESTAHMSHHYIAALRPRGLVTEFGD